MEHIRQDVLKFRFVAMKFRLDLEEAPIKMHIPDNQPFPQWQGAMTASYTIGQPEEEGLNYDDFQEVQAYDKYEEYKNH